MEKNDIHERITVALEEAHEAGDMALEAAKRLTECSEEQRADLLKEVKKLNKKVGEKTRLARGLIKEARRS